MKTLYRHAWVLAGLALSFQACASPGLLAGEPPYTSFEPQLTVFPQNFALAQDRNSIVYIGNYDGVITFDGERWRLITLPNHEVVRSLAYDGSGRVYVGGYNDFGYIDHDAAGQPVYHDLLPAFRGLVKKPDFEDIWDVDVTPQGVFFGALKSVFYYNPKSGRVRAWHYPGRFGAMAGYQGSLVLQFRGEGLKIYRKGKWTLLPGSELFKHLLYSLVPLDSGGLLALSAAGDWREYRDGKVRPFTVPAGFPASSHFFAGRALSDHTLALSADNGNLYLLSTDGKRDRRVQLADGSLSGLIKANDGGLLVIGDQALFHVQWPTAWTVINEKHGLAGTLSKAVKWNGDWYILTGSGVFRAGISANGKSPEFHRLPWTDHSAWDLLPLDRRHALLAESYGVMEVGGGKAKLLTPEHLYPRILVRSRFHKDRVYVGTESGLAALVETHGAWHLLFDNENMDGLEVSSIVETSPKSLWIGSGRGGIRSLDLSADGERIISQKTFGAGEGLAYGKGLHDGDIALLPNDKLVASTAAGEFLWDGKRFRSYDVDGLEPLRKPGELFTFSVRGKDIWACSDNRVFHRAVNSDRWTLQPISQFRHGAIQGLDFLENGGVMVVTTNALLHYIPLHYDPVLRPPHVLLRSVVLTRSDGRKDFLPLYPAKPLQLPKGNFSLAFRFALPDYTGRETALYRARLAGIETRLSSWAPNSIYTYSQLGSGNYRFELVGRDVQGNVTKIRPFAFDILPPWYTTVWAWITWIFLAGLTTVFLAAWFVHFRTRQLAADKARLEGMVKERTVELQRANNRLQAMVHIDSLTAIPNRRRMDDYLNQVWSHCLSGRRPLSVLVIDVDQFKQYNDRHGHLAGDKLLQDLVTILGHCLRRSEDLLARYGGEEFLVVLPGAAVGMARDLGEHMRKEVESSDLNVTISVGVATCMPGEESTARKLVHEADEALYQAKAGGRNKTIVAANSSSPAA